MGVATRAGWLAAALALAAPGAASGAVTFRLETTPAPVLVVTSDADDAIVLSCVDDRLALGGAPVEPALGCTFGRLRIEGGPGANLIDLRALRVFEASGIFVGGSIVVEAGAGDDVVLGSGEYPRRSPLAALAGRLP